MPSNVDKHSVAGEQPVRLCNYVDVYKNERITEAMDFMEATATDAQIDRFTLRANDVIVTKDSEEATDIGIPAYVPSDLPGVVCGYHLAVLRPDHGRLHGGYLHWALQSAEVQAYYARAATGISRYALGIQDLGMTAIHAPSVSEQERIANFLDEQTARLDALIAEKERLLNALDEFRLSTINQCVAHGISDVPQVLTGDYWFPQVPAGWAFCALNYRYQVELGKMLDEKRQTGHNPTPYLRNVDVRWDYVNTESLPSMDVSPEELERYSVREGDLLVCEGGVGVGRSAIWRGPDNKTAYQKALHRVRPRSDADVPRFLFYLMQDAVWRERVLGHEKATIPHLTAEAFRRWRFPFPPLDVQRAIVRYLDGLSSRTSELTAHCSEHIERLREYRSSLITAAVTGQLDISTLKAAA